jgi:hypothetical protein
LGTPSKPDRSAERVAKAGFGGLDDGFGLAEGLVAHARGLGYLVARFSMFGRWCKICTTVVFRFFSAFQFATFSRASPCSDGPAKFAEPLFFAFSPRFNLLPSPGLMRVA